MGKIFKMNHDMNEEKTEQPTEHRIKKFKKKGTTRYSRELNSLLILIFGLLTLWFSKYSIFLELKKIMINSFCFSNDIFLDRQNIFLTIKEILIIFFPFSLCLMCIIIIPSILFSGIQFNCTSLKVNFSKLNPLNGFKRIFSFQIFVEIFKITLKLLIIGSISIFYLWVCFFKIFSLNIYNPTSYLYNIFSLIAYCCIFVLLGLVPIVILDVFWQEWKYYKKLKMTHQEIKDEFKEREGNPNIKIRIRQQMKQNLQRRMILDVPKADVIITNPVHCSVALKYDIEKMNAPKVIAKGVGNVAIKIKEIGIKNNVSIISVPSLARSLYRYSEIGQYIPGSFYKAVAEILAWVWNVRKWKKEGGTFPEKPKNISIPSELNFTGESKNND